MKPNPNPLCCGVSGPVKGQLLLSLAAARGWQVITPPMYGVSSFLYNHVIQSEGGVVRVCSPFDDTAAAVDFQSFITHLNAGPAPSFTRKIVRCDWTMHEGGDGTNLIVTARNPEGTRLALPYSILRKILATWPDAKLPGTGDTEESPF